MAASKLTRGATAPDKRPSQGAWERPVQGGGGGRTTKNKDVKNLGAFHGMGLRMKS